VVVVVAVVAVAVVLLWFCCGCCGCFADVVGLCWLLCKDGTLAIVCANPQGVDISTVTDKQSWYKLSPEAWTEPVAIIGS